MKKVLLTVTMLLLVSRAFAYDRTSTLVGSRVDNGFFVAPVAKYSQLADQWGLMFGGRAGWIINRALSIGGGYYSLAPGNIRVSGRDYSLSYGGAELEFIMDSDEVLHLTFSTLLGGGSVGAEGVAGAGSSFYTIEPGLAAVMNVTKNFRAGLSVHYRLVTGVNSSSVFSSSNAGGFSAALQFMLGIF